jgi:hypothetical protein
MGWIELAESDREKYGAPERIPLEYGRWGLKSVDALETQVGWTLEDLGNELQRKKRDVTAMLSRRTNSTTTATRFSARTAAPKQVEVTAPSKLAEVALVWMCLRAVGVRIPWDEFDVQMIGLRVSWGDDDEGKALEPADSPEDLPA